MLLSNEFGYAVISIPIIEHSIIESVKIYDLVKFLIYPLNTFIFYFVEHLI